MKSLIVGTQWCVPGCAIIGLLPRGTRLTFMAEPTNPHDKNALQVLASPQDVPASHRPYIMARDLKRKGRDKMEGWTLSRILSLDSTPIGYVAATGGKPLERMGWIHGNADFIKFIARHREYDATLEIEPMGMRSVILKVRGMP